MAPVSQMIDVAATPPNSPEPLLPDPDTTPLVVDLDGTLVVGDTLVEGLALLVSARPASLARLPLWLLRGKASFKQAVAARAGLSPASLPFNPEVMRRLRAAKAAGRPAYLATGADRATAETLAQYLGHEIGAPLDGVFASDGKISLTGARKAARLCDAFGHGGFDYIGDEGRDLAIWRVARRALVVAPSERLLARLYRVAPDAEVIPGTTPRLLDYVRALRPHQWLKNVLVFLPLIAAHVIAGEAFLAALGAFAALCLVASGTYLGNDILDLPEDRAHPSKCRRPLASGSMPLGHGLALAPVLVLAGLALAAAVSMGVLALVGVYLVGTSAYSLYFKRQIFVDVVILAALYVVRVLVGVAAIGVPVSPWFLAFSMFLFLMLALVKRHKELTGLLAAERTQADGRAYAVGDLPVLAALGAASGFAAVLVLALYLNSPEVDTRYTRPEVLWLLCPLLMYWMGRLLILANRGEVHDDPVVFALGDRVSLIVGALSAASFAGAL